MVDVTEISAIVAAVGVLIGIIYYILDIRNQAKIRQTDLLLRLHSLFDKEWNRDLSIIYGREYLDYDDYVKRYGRYGSRPTTKQNEEFEEAFESAMNKVEVFGLLLRRRMVSVDFMFQMLEGIKLWERVRPLVEAIRKDDKTPTLWEHFEYYYIEMKKYQQKLWQRSVKNG